MGATHDGVDPQAVSRGVSANLCDALVGMGSSGEGNRAVDVQFSWSRNRPLASNQQINWGIAAPGPKKTFRSRKVEIQPMRRVDNQTVTSRHNSASFLAFFLRWL